MSTMPLSCHENPICLILPIGQQLPNYHKVLQLYKYVFKEIESYLQNLKEGQECGENICDLIIILCQSANGNATRVLESRNWLIFLWTLRNFDFTSTSSLFTDITQVKLYEHKIASKEKTFHFVFDLVLFLTKQALKCKFQTKSSLQTVVLHPNLCVCFHSAVTFWLNDRQTVY